MRASIVGFAFSTTPRDADYVPIGHGALGAVASLPLDDTLAILRPVLEDGSIRKDGHDLKFDAIVLSRHGVTLRGLEIDTLLASYLLDATSSARTLEDLALEHTSYKALTEEDVCGRGVKALSLAALPAEATVDYAGERADLVDQLAPIFRGLLDKEQLTGVYDTLELPLIPVLVAVERAGVRIDLPALASQSQTLEQDLAQRTAQIYALAGSEFNINSPKQLAEVLFDKLQLPVLKRTGTSRAPSTAVEVLEELALAHDLPRMILEWRGLMKLKGTYIDALPLLVNPDTGRIHTCFNQAVAATGRLSSSDPNLQNIPIRTALGREIRGAFIADPGHVLISADYSQIELRVLAHLAEDETLIEAFRRGDDIHDQTALKVFGPDSDKDKHQQRSIAKMINYALLYGKTAFTLSKDIGVTQQAAQEFIDAYFAGFPAVRSYIDRTLEEARVTGVVKTMFGRRRLMPELTSRDFQRAASGRGARSGQHADPGHGRRHHEAGDAPLPRGAGLAARRTDDPHGPRRAAVRGPREARRRPRRARASGDGISGGAEGAADGGHRDRGELERRQRGRWALPVPHVLELLPLEPQRVRLLTELLRAVGDDRPQDEAIEIGAQRGAVIGRQRRAHPAGLRGIPR